MLSRFDCSNACWSTTQCRRHRALIGDPLAAQRNKRHEKDNKPETRVVGIESRIGAARPAGAVAARLVALSVVMRSDAVDRGWHADVPRGATSMLPAGNEPIKARGPRSRCYTQVADPIGLAPMVKQVEQLTEDVTRRVADPIGLVPMVKQVEQLTEAHASCRPHRPCADGEAG